MIASKVLEKGFLIPVVTPPHLPFTLNEYGMN